MHGPSHGPTGVQGHDYTSGVVGWPSLAAASAISRRMQRSTHLVGHGYCTYGVCLPHNFFNLYIRLPGFVLPHFCDIRRSTVRDKSG